MKFKTVVKNFSLDFLGEDWKDAHINFQAVTIGDIKNKFPEIAQVDTNNPESVADSLDKILTLLEERFIDGSAPGEKEMVSLSKEDIKDLPGEVIGRALTFLSQGATPPSSTP